MWARLCFYPSIIPYQKQKIGSQELHVATTVKKKKMNSEFNIRNWHSCVTRFHATCVKWAIPKKSTPLGQIARLFFTHLPPRFPCQLDSPFCLNFQAQRCPPPPQIAINFLEALNIWVMKTINKWIRIQILFLKFLKLRWLLQKW